MKKEYKSIITFVIGALFLTPLGVFGYEPYSTHAGLTQEIIEFYELYFDAEIDNNLKEKIIKGSIDEDFPTVRSLSHFYDPIRKMGFNGGRSAKDWAIDSTFEGNDYSWPKAIKAYAEGDEELAFEALGHILHLVQDVSVPDHTRNDPHKGQGVEGLGTGESPYEDWTGENKDRSTLSGLGRTIFEQGGKPYIYGGLPEYFDTLAEYSNGNFFSKDSIENEIYQYENPKISRYGLMYGYAIDPIYEKEYKVVKKVEINKDEIALLLYEDDDYSVIESYFERLSEQAVLHGAGVVDLFFKQAKRAREEYEEKKRREYESEVAKATEQSRKLAGAGFFEKLFLGAGYLVADAVGGVAAPLKDGAAVAYREATVFVQGANNFGNIAVQTVPVAARSAADQVAQVANDVAETAKESLSFVQERVSDSVESGSAFQSVGTLNLDFGSESEEVEENSDDNLPEENVEPVVETGSEPEITIEATEVGEQGDETGNENSTGISASGSTQITIIPGFGGGGGGTDEHKETKPADAKSSGEAKQIDTDDDDGETREDVDTEAPDAPIVAQPDDFSSVFTDLEIDFSGTSEVGAIVSASVGGEELASDVVGDDGSWELALTLSNGSQDVSFVATDDAGNVSESETVTVIIDASAPTVSLLISECGQSISDEGCFLVGDEVEAVWESDDGDLDYFLLKVGDTEESTTATSSEISLTFGADTIIEVRAVDNAGNVSEPATQTVFSHNSPVVINEVAWMGTKASPFDEWIELYNRTDKEIDLSNFTLQSNDQSPYIPLEGTIAPYGYYLIERKNGGESDEATESPVVDVVADMWVSFGSGLANGGEELELLYSSGSATTTIDEVPLCFGRWCGGTSGGSRTSMQRFRVSGESDDEDNWGSAGNEIFFNGVDIDGNAIAGTPKAKNDISYGVAVGSTISEDVTLSAEESPYYVKNLVTIAGGATLTIEPGVVIKFGDTSSRLLVRGKIVAEGSEDEPVVFTSIYDDEYGGDLNGDGDDTVPAPRDWDHILLTDESEGSVFSYSVFLYGGKKVTGSQMPGIVSVVDSDAEFENVTVGYADGHGLYFENSTGFVRDSIFSDNDNYSNSAGLYIVGGEVEVSGNEFSGNTFGLDIENSSDSSVEENIFSDNETALQVSGALPEISDNTGSGNGENAIVFGLGTTITESGATTTMRTNSLPYLLAYDGYVAEDSTLTFESGVVIKGHDNRGSKAGQLVVNRAGARIYFDGDDSGDLVLTSMNDDSVGGTVDSDDTLPSGGDWDGISVDDGGEISLSGFTLKYAGGPTTAFPIYRGAIIVGEDSAQAEISNGIISDSSVAAIRIDGEGEISITNMEFSDNEIDIVGDVDSVAECDDSCLGIVAVPLGIVQ
ncbi:MAG: hypothetical protein COV70_03005 [Parcubacteria group bacterium CG11_big_fil_rev_8_21_14_0_20_39_22]|nr:MAG: hypothetical protein COV70_03005 [Parcubacteria group bacterium CG11_big_fil_rev_8_21_14_0_20_39_22]